MPAENTRSKNSSDRFGTTILEWDLVNQGFSASDSFFNYAMSRVDGTELLKNFDAASQVNAEDLSALQGYLKLTSTEQANESAMLRFKDTSGQDRWTCFSLRYFFDEKNQPVRVMAVLLDIDEEIRYNQHLEQENQALHGIIEGISLGIGIFEINEYIIPTYLSDRACAILGYTSEEMDTRIEKRTPIWFKMAADDDPLGQIPEHLFKPLLSGETVESKISVKRKDGVWIWLHVLCTLRSKTKDQSECYVTIRDISSLPRAETERNWQEERYRILSESEQVVTFEYDIQADTLDYNIFTDEGVLKNIHIVRFIKNLGKDKRIHPDSVITLREALLNAKESQRSHAIDILADFHGRDYQWWRLRYTYVFDDTSSVSHVVGRADDIQREKETEAKLLASVDKEASFRRSITAGALLALEFDAKTGKRVVSTGDILPKDISDQITLEELTGLLAKHAHPEESALMAEHMDIKKILHNLTTSKRKISFDYRSRSICNRFEGYRWFGITYMCAMPETQGYQHVLIYIMDIHEKKNSQLLLMDQAKRDPLTGLLNRAAFKEFFSDLLTGRQAEDVPKSLDAFVMLDMNRLQEINDTYGYAFGDKMLKSVAVTLQAMRCESAARLDGDKFALCIHEIPTEAVLREQMRILRDALTQKVSETVTLSATIGISIYPTDAETYDELYEKADQALCIAKKMGNQGFAFYSPDIELSEFEKINITVDHAGTSGEKRIYIRTFGYFDVFVDGQAIPFKVVKAKELLALLVDRRGGFLSAGDAISFLWEDEPANELTMSRYRKVAMRLKSILAEFGIENILESINGLRRVVPEKFDCDYYDYVSASPQSRGHFPGAYLTNYSWGESTLSVLEEMNDKA